MDGDHETGCGATSRYVYSDTFSCFRAPFNGKKAPSQAGVKMQRAGDLKLIDDVRKQNLEELKRWARDHHTITHTIQPPPPSPPPESVTFSE